MPFEVNDCLKSGGLSVAKSPSQDSCVFSLILKLETALGIFHLAQDPKS